MSKMADVLEGSSSSARVPKDESVMIDLQKQLKTANISLPELSTLAQKGDEKLVEKFLSENIDIEGDDETKKHSQLYIAAFWGFHDIVKSLLDTGVEINYQNKGTLWTPLHAATFQENGKVVMLLLERGAQPELQDSEGRSPKDFASASEKIWAHFAMLGCPRSSKQELINKGIIKKIDRPPSSSNINSASTPPVSAISRPAGSGIRMAAYSRPDSAYAIRPDPFQRNKSNNSSQMAALLGGDVLAEEDIKPKGQSPNQPNFSIWRS
ncbi:ankyrin repeat and protein kinase domain-containing protein 1-like [Ptychodera flava]|uniref:ankyrin repeat and protein kinase domain-containing protein 1-like n=1 Tax=Ptychodera flava TaxID=63121 RepID=UPI003969FDB3